MPRSKSKYLLLKNENDESILSFQPLLIIAECLENKKSKCHIIFILGL